MTDTATGELTLGFSGPGDRVEQARLYDACFDKSDGAKVIAWRYDGNPQGDSIVSVARTTDGEMVSSYACQARDVHHHGDPAASHLIGQTGDVMTDPRWRSKGVFSDIHWAAMHEAQRRGWPVAWGLPNNNSGHIFFNKLGWHDIGRIGPWTFVLTPDAVARQERLPAGRVASIGVPWSWWRGNTRRSHLRELASGLRVERIGRFQPDVDPISEAVEKDFAWMVRRDHRYVNWRFLDAPSGLFRAHGAYTPGGELRGYSVVQLPRPGSRKGFVVDVLAYDDAALAAVLDAALVHLTELGASIARAYAMRGSWWEEKLAWAGFRPPKRGGYKPVGGYAILPDHPLGRAVLDTSRWYFTDGDRDDETAR